MTDYNPLKARFKGTVNEKGDAKSASLLGENFVIFEEIEAGSNRIKCIFSNSEFIRTGEERLLAEKMATEPSPKYEIFSTR